MLSSAEKQQHNASVLKLTIQPNQAYTSPPIWSTNRKWEGLYKAESRNQNDNIVVWQYKQFWHFKNRTCHRAFKKTSGYNNLLSDSEAHSIYICPKARFEKEKRFNHA